MAWHRPSLEKLSQVAFIAMCVAVTAVGVQRVTRRPDAGAAAVRTAPLPPGAKLALHERLRPAGARGAVVLALSTNCQYCTASMPFYHRLQALDAVKTGNLRLSVISLQPEPQMREYLASHSVTIDRIVRFPDSGMTIRGTPTLVLVNAEGEVVNSWAGQLRPDEEAEFLQALNRLAGS